MAEQQGVLCSTTVAAGGYTNGSGVLNVASTSTGSGPLPFPASGTFTVSISDPTTRIVKSLLRVTGVNSPTQFATSSAAGLDVSCVLGDIVEAVLDGVAFQAIASKPVSGYVATDESTASTTYVDLTTLDTVTIFLPAISNVVIIYLADGYQVGGAFPGNLWNIINIDGSDVAGTDALSATIAATEEIPSICKYLKTSLAAGSHTIKIRHKTTSGTAHWLNRLLTAQMTN